MKKKFGIFLQTCLLLVTMLLLAAAPVMADVMYTYTGNSYNYFTNPTGNPDFGTHLTASFTFDSNVVTNDYTGYQYFSATSTTFNDIISWSATSGSTTLSSSANSYEQGAMFSFINGDIDVWYFAVGTDPGYYLASYNCGYGIADVAINYYFNDEEYKLSGVWSNPGMWTKQQDPSNPVPEPSTILLLGLGLAGIVGARKKFKK